MNNLEYKASAFRQEHRAAELLYEVKRVSAVWDPDLAGGHGGWRCPPGTENAGQWSDEFGRNCGGISRRLGRAIGTVGQAVQGNAPGGRRARVNVPGGARLHRPGDPINAPNKPDLPDPKLGRRAARANRLEEHARALEVAAAAPRERKKRRVDKLEARAAALEHAAGIERDPETRKPRLIRLPRPEPEAPASRFLRPPGDEARKRRAARKRRIGNRPAPLRARQGGPAKREPVGVRKERREERERQRAAVEAAKKFINEIAQNPNLEQDLHIRERPESIKTKKGFRRINGELRLNVHRNDLDMDQAKEIENYLDQIDKRLVKVDAVRDDPQGLVRELDELNQLVENLSVLGNHAATNIIDARRRDKKGEKIDEVAALQHQMDILKYQEANDLIVSRRNEINQRQNFMRDRQIAQDNLDFIVNPDNDPLDRADALKNLQWYVKNGNRPDSDWASVGVAEFWEGMDVQHLANQPAVQRSVEEQYGTFSDFNEIMNLGGPPLRKRQDKIDKALTLFDEDESKDLTLLDVLITDMQDELDALGAPVRALTPEDRYENNNRQWLKTNIDKLKQAKKAARKQVVGRPSFYDFEPKEHPEKLGNLYEDGRTVLIKNENIKTAHQAIEHIANGGSLQEVPNQYWGIALKENSSQDKHDMTKRYYQVPKNGGAIGFTLIFVSRDERGKPTNSGWLVKGSDDEDNIGEVASQILMVEHGLPVMGPGWDGKTKALGGDAREEFVVLPFFANAAGEGDVIKASRGGSNYDPNLLEGSDEYDALPQRLHGMLHNYMLGVTDRHEGNGFTAIVGGKPIVVPIDQGRSAWTAEVNMDSYAKIYGMDRQVLFEVGEKVHNLNAESIQNYQEKITEVYDSIIDAGNRVLELGYADFSERIFAGHIGPIPPDAERKLTIIWANYERRIRWLEMHRLDLLKRVGVR